MAERGCILREYNLNKLAQSYNSTALYYNLVTPIMAGAYRRAAIYVLKQQKLAAPRVLDIGTGTGLLAGAFAAQGAQVTGVDISPGMLNKARRKYKDRILFLQAPAHAPGQFPDQSFDIVTAGFVLHGMPADYRHQVLKQMKRLAATSVAIVDFVPNLNPVVALIERLEGSFYKEFLKEIPNQLQQLFTRYEVRKLNHFMGLYLCYMSP